MLRVPSGARSSKEMPWRAVWLVYLPITQSLDELNKIVPLSSISIPSPRGRDKLLREMMIDSENGLVARSVRPTRTPVRAPDGSYTAAIKDRRAANPPRVGGREYIWIGSPFKARVIPMYSSEEGAAS